MHVLPQWSYGQVLKSLSTVNLRTDTKSWDLIFDKLGGEKKLGLGCPNGCTMQEQHLIRDARSKGFVRDTLIRDLERFVPSESEEWLIR